LVIGCFAAPSGNQVFVEGSGYDPEMADDVGTGTAGGSDFSFFVQSQVFASAGTQDCEASWTFSQAVAAISFQILEA
jgi:hypothetical protein